MASLRSILYLVTVFCYLFEECFSFNPKHLNLSLTATRWNSAGATWYGSPDGFGSDGNILMPIYIVKACEMGRVFIILYSTNHKHNIITIANRSLHAGGSCGYGDVVSQPPFSSMVTSVGPSLYKSGTECGACYQVYIYI